jgi:hypothetical protein
MRAKKLLSGLMIAVWVFLTGCTVSIATTVDPNGTGEVKVIYKLSQDDQKTFSQSGMSDASKLCEGFSTMSQSFQGGTSSIKQEKHGSETWCVMSQAFGSLEEMRAKLNEQDFTINTLAIQNGRFVFDATLNMGSGSSDSNLGLPIGITYELTLPGKAISHNADKVKGYTLIWEMGMGQTKQIHAESGVEGRSTDWLGLIQQPIVILPCIGIIVLVLVVLIIGEVVRGSRPKPPAAPEAPGEL